MSEPLSREAMISACETLDRAFRYTLDHNFPGAVGRNEPAGIFIEAKRNLFALMIALHGSDA